MDHNKKRKIIGFLVTGITDTYSVKLIQGVARAARNLDLDILVMPGKYLDRDLSRQFEDTYEYQFTTLYSYAAAIGLDNLKVVNDRFGHDDGDYALRVIAEVLTRTMQGERCILGRIGGDEFVFLLAGTEDRAGSVKTAIYDAFAVFNQASSKEYNVTVSVGIWTAPADMQVTLEDMLSYADTILYEEKQNKDRNILKHL